MVVSSCQVWWHALVSLSAWVRVCVGCVCKCECVWVVVCVWVYASTHSCCSSYHVCASICVRKQVFEWMNGRLWGSVCVLVWELERARDSESVYERARILKRKSCWFFLQHPSRLLISFWLESGAHKKYLMAENKKRSVKNMEGSEDKHRIRD